MTHSIRRYEHHTGNPLTRRCIKCGEEKNLEEFKTPLSKAQAALYKYGPTDVDGIELLDGKFLRGYTRPMRKRFYSGMKCDACRNPRKPHHPEGGKTYLEVAAQIRSKRLKLKSSICQLPKLRLDPTGKAAREAYYHACRLMLHRAAYLARQRRRQGVKCPPRWEQLLSEKERTEVYTLHAAVLWRGIVPEVY